MKPAMTDIVLTIPPLVRDEKDSSTPSAPKTIATMARTKPHNAPVAKLATAAIIAMKEGMLNLARRVSTAFMAESTPRT